MEATQWEFTGGQKIFGRYTLVKILGQGGMGVVWLARDEELERDVALKFLPQAVVHERDLIDNLKRETRRSLELTHKNIVRIYDFVHDERMACISMEYVDGETLSNLRTDKEQKVFEPSELAAWTRQLCEALDYAHNYARVIHRDLKPANLILNRRGELKVSDFGIARSLSDTVSHVTAEQGRSGTLVYMSPQQLEGKRGTHLDDIYSLGATLYDLLTSKPPFYSGNIDRQIHERVPPSMTERRKDLNIESASVPPIWEQVIAACLQKDPAKRPQSAMEVAHRLQLSALPIPPKIVRRAVPSKAILWAGAAVLICLMGLGTWYFAKSKLHVARPAPTPLRQAAAISEKSIAVMPFENRSPDPDNAYFADGIQDEILTRLSKIADLKVISRTSTQHYKSAPENLPKIAKQLGVAHILEGSVQKSGDDVRVNVQLIKALDDSHLWADTFDRKLTDIFAVESDIAKTIADTLQAKLTGMEKQMIAVQPTKDTTAYELFLRGRSLWGKRGGDNIWQAITFYEQAIARDPNYAPAYAGMAEAYATLPAYTATPPWESYPKAKAAAVRALQLDEKQAQAHTALAYVLCLGDRDMTRSVSEFERAIALNPNYATAHQWYANGPLLAVGRFDESIAEGKRAMELDPLSPVINSDLGENFIYARRYDEAIAQLQKTVEIDPTFHFAHYNLGRALQLRGDVPAAIAEYEKAEQFNQDALVLLAAAKAQLGDKEAAVRTLTELADLSKYRYVNAYSRALLYLSLKNRDEAIRWLEQGIANQDGAAFAWLKVDPMLDPLRGDPRFEALVQRVFAPKSSEARPRKHSP